MSSPDASPKDQPESLWWRRHWAQAFFALALLIHFGLVTHNWPLGNLSGHEFRQTQTALSILFIQQDRDYSLAYPTPLFGPPWSIPMEFPLYQWSVALLMETTGWSVPVAGRTVTLLCFYLTLPGIGLLLKRWGADKNATWLTLGMILSTPVYLFYGRAILIESMALMLAVWFLFAFAKICERGSIRWIVLATLLGCLAALVKVTTLFVWCLPAALVGLKWSWEQLREHGIGAWIRTVVVGAAVAVPIGLANWWWISFADGIKAASPGGQSLQSAEMTATNWGTWQDRIDPESLHRLGLQLSVAVLPPFLFFLLLALVVIGAVSFRGRIVGLVLWLVATLATFPVLYHRHDYYFFAIAVAPVAALAIGIAEGLKKPGIRWLAGSMLAATLVLFGHGYYRNYAHLQWLVSYGGTGLTYFIKDMLPADRTLIVVGQDWAPVIPYYAQRRALMIRDQVAGDRDLLQTHLAQLEAKEVSALIVTGDPGKYEETRELAAKKFLLDHTHSLRHHNTRVYLATDIREATLNRLRENQNYSGVTDIGSYRPPPPPEPIIADQQIHPVTAKQAESTFVEFSPRPTRYRCQFGFARVSEAGKSLLGCHPDSDLWVPMDGHAREVHYGLGLVADAYADSSVNADGVLFAIHGIDQHGVESVLVEHDINPVLNVADRGILNFSTEVPAEVVELRFSTRGKSTLSYDWAFWGQVTLK